MAFERFTKEARAAVAGATQEATAESADGTVEAEHLLLALSRHPDIQALGLDHEELRAALHREEERSLAAVGVSAAEFDLGASPGRRPRFSRWSGRPPLATSTKLALQRALTSAVDRRDRTVTARHLLAGVIAAERGRVPRALELAGIDVANLRRRVP